MTAHQPPAPQAAARQPDPEQPDPEQPDPEQPDPDGAASSATPPRRGRLAGRWDRVAATAEAGMSTAEYAVGTVAACAFAAVLYRVVTGGSIVSALGDLVESALGVLS
ncbi:hypothetical protein JOD57_003015 [Geodermatophilus bullaregiensis]|uniref:DUF4244 domain-containing protein n=1 Tax=Geodermatophilus bullaregiensis TaxID=1564160 RepID=UPI0027DCEFBA|nr:DUF4244 domain-containing protein [Geodermatophilus bullaregiensis]MBM7807178.1 hypothetical protein [Geodermatophilus bullaregiensis]